jgi:hypothetical protein
MSGSGLKAWLAHSRWVSRMAGEAGGVTSSTIVWRLQVEGKEDVTQTMKTTQGMEKDGLVIRKEMTRQEGTAAAQTRTLTTTYKDQADIERQLLMQRKQQLMAMHQYNMAILGVNMSLLGLSFNLSTLAGDNKELAKQIRTVIAPMQIMLTLLNMGMSLNQLYAMSVYGIGRAMNYLTASMIVVGLVMAAIATKSPILKGIFLALAAVIGILTVRYMALSWAQLMASATKPIIGLALVALAAAALGAAWALNSSYKSRAFGGGFVAGTPVQYGEVTEAIIPLQSPRAMNMGLMGPGSTKGGITIMNANFIIKADRPSVLYKEIQNATNRHTFVTTR